MYILSSVQVRQTSKATEYSYHQMREHTFDFLYDKEPVKQPYLIHQ